MQSMRWWKHLFIKVLETETLNRAFDDVIESKKQEDRRHPERPSMVERYIKMKPKIVWQLKKELMDRTYHLTIRPSFDRMERGKLRRITPPSFRDSVIYHAVIIALEPYLINRFYFYSLGSIPGKGPWVGLNNLQSKLKDNRKKTKYCLQIDVRKFYDTIPRDLLMQRFGRRIKDQQFLWLLSVIISEQPGNGLPLGAYTSGWFANFYLDPIDHFLKQEIKVEHLYRYVDDMVILGPNKKELHKLRKVLEKKLLSIGLNLKGNWQVYPVDARKIDFLGFKTGRNVRIDRKRNMNEFARFVKKNGRNPTPGQASSIESRRGRCSKFASHTFLNTRIEPYTNRYKNRRVLKNEAHRRIDETKQRA